jgi:transposase
LSTDLTVGSVIVGVDTHSDLHLAVAIDGLGRRLGELSVPTTRSGSQRLEVWARSWDSTPTFGIEGTGSWGANLARYLRGLGHTVVEVNRPDRTIRRRRASPIQSTPKSPRAPYWPVPRPARRKPVTARSR